MVKRWFSQDRNVFNLSCRFKLSANGDCKKKEGNSLCELPSFRMISEFLPTKYQSLYPVKHQSLLPFKCQRLLPIKYQN